MLGGLQLLRKASGLTDENEEQYQQILDETFANVQSSKQWQNHVPFDIAELWDYLCPETKVAIYLMASDLARGPGPQ